MELLKQLAQSQDSRVKKAAKINLDAWPQRWLLIIRTGSDPKRPIRPVAHRNAAIKKKLPPHKIFERGGVNCYPVST